MDALGKAFAALGRQQQESKPGKKSWESLEAYIEDITKASEGKSEEVVGANILFQAAGYGLVVFFKKNGTTDSARLCLRELKNKDGKWVNHPNVNVNVKHIPTLTKMLLAVLLDCGNTEEIKDILTFISNQSKTSTEED